MSGKLEEVVSRWCDALNAPAGELNVIEEFEGGSANKSFLIDFQTKKVVARLRQELAGRFPRSWDAELYATKCAEDVGLAPNIVFECDSPQAILSEYGGRPEKGRLSMDKIQALSRALARLHALEFDVQKLPRQNYLSLIDDYFRMVGSTSVRKDLESSVVELKALANSWAQRFKPCFTHHDLTRENILWQSGRVVFVDWEYACVGNPEFDLATVARSFEMNACETKLLRKTYNASGGASSLSDEEHIKMQRFVGLLGKLWYAAVSDQLAPEKVMLL